MNFKIDENLPTELADELRQLGHDADTVYGEGLAGAMDPEVVEAGASPIAFCSLLTKASRMYAGFRPGNMPAWFCFDPRTAGLCFLIWLD
jgi:hypothetical protein